MTNVFFKRHVFASLLLLLKLEHPDHKENNLIMPPFEKGGHIALHLSVGWSVGRSVGLYVGMSVSLNFVQLITPERFAPKASNLVGR